VKLTRSATAGYSGTPLAKKLGVSEGRTVFAVGAPARYKELLAPLPPRVRFVTKVEPATDIIHLFVTERDELSTRLSGLRSAIRPDAAIWVSWPKKAAKVPTDITEDVIREVALPLGFVDVKVCAIDETWSGLKRVIRKANRPSVRRT
jgi:hypothetical protein